MLQNSRLKHLLAAGMLTGLALATLMAFAWRDTSRANVQKPPTIVTMTAPAGMDAWQAENAQLRQAVAAMRAREKAYHTQLEAANRTIVQMQEVAATPRNGDHEEYEDHEHADERGEDKDD